MFHTKILLCSLKSAINSTIDSSYGHMIRAFFSTFYLFIFRRLIQTSQNLL
nr:MAG TPA: hypothetical protein [Caudoviricetes sp.]